MKTPFRIMALAILLAGMIAGCSSLQKQEDDGQPEQAADTGQVEAPPPPAPRVEDTDSDGIANQTDRCPNTPAGAPVNRYGCWVPDPIYFATGAWKVDADTARKLDEIADVLVQNPAVRMFLYGHSDNTGSEEANRDLSRRRADAVETYLIGNGVAKDQLIKKWFGSDLPKATNKTDEGRLENRRVELILLK